VLGRSETVLNEQNNLTMNFNNKVEMLTFKHYTHDITNQKNGLGICSFLSKVNYN